MAAARRVSGRREPSVLRRCCRCRWSVGGSIARSDRPTCHRSRWRHGWPSIRPSSRSTSSSRAPKRIFNSFPMTAAAGTCWRPSISGSGRYDDSIVAYQQGDQAARRDRGPRIRAGRSDRRCCRRQDHRGCAGCFRARARTRAAASEIAVLPGQRPGAGRPYRRCVDMPGTPCAPACRPARRGWR